MKLVIGLGTGRCGTVSLAKFLDSQEGFWCTHEGVFSRNWFSRSQILLPWDIDSERYELWKNAILVQGATFKYVGDVGSYFLPYVEKIMNDFPSVKFICLERPKSEVVESFMIKTTGRNHWMRVDEKQFRVHVWDTIHPKFQAGDKRQALEMYWDYYHTTVHGLQEKYPLQFTIVPHTELNSPNGRNRILDAADFQGFRKTSDTIHSNRNQGVFIERLKYFLWDIYEKIKH